MVLGGIGPAGPASGRAWPNRSQTRSSRPRIRPNEPRSNRSQSVADLTEDWSSSTQSSSTWSKSDRPDVVGSSRIGPVSSSKESRVSPNRAGKCCDEMRFWLQRSELLARCGVRGPTRHQRTQTLASVGLTWFEGGRGLGGGAGGGHASPQRRSPSARLMPRRPRRHCALAAKYSAALRASPARGWNEVGGEQYAGYSTRICGIEPGK